MMGYPQASASASALALPHVFASLLLLVAAHAFASADNVSNALQASQPSSIQITLSKQADAAIRLEARDAPLGQILKAIADKTGVNIHYSVLPEAPVTATCVGANVGQVMDCLVAKQVGLVAHKSQKDHPAEFWLLGSSVGSCQAVTVAASPIQVATEPQPTREEQAQIDQMLQEQVDQLLKQAQSKDPNVRSMAINSLGSLGAKNDPNVDEALRNALTDKDVNVRSQAIAAIAERGGANLEEQLSLALKDKDVSVRLSAVGLAKEDDIGIFQQALNDSDPTVKELAQNRLQAVTSQQGQGDEATAAEAGN
ncbi:MAG: HEAT repeat domain-containing protein [Methyloglobulus sp.]|nr:HEAT repeat domain-containing protein [Methyloglobulus sp.]